jgi:hypothetical protein
MRCTRKSGSRDLTGSQLSDFQLPIKGSGFRPLGFMMPADNERVCYNMRLANRVPWLHVENPFG